MENKKNRNTLACKFCLKPQESLPVHLRRACKRNADDKEIELVMLEAKEKMRAILKGLSVVDYEDLDHKDHDPLQFFVKFLEKNGCYVRGKPEESPRGEVEEIGGLLNMSDGETKEYFVAYAPFHGTEAKPAVECEEIRGLPDMSNGKNKDFFGFCSSPNWSRLCIHLT
ncbi:hypothetical protein XELAEV_18034022mg [Xenopus laevis]|uniref:Uncharacterized protein n=1 Tax=Xenopus laevis TaxID=8355 RepID=A0A974HEK5_XENLA|nr:hypothetical protein XELAEV_18034022mg [Xenopus laevis]